MKALDEFTTAYLAVALWTETDETNPEQGGEPLDDNYDVDDIEPDTLAEMIQDCRQFQDDNASLIIDENIRGLYCGSLTHQYSGNAKAGHDFWLTRNRHGAGFWDGDWKKPAASKLTDAAQAFGEYHITATGDGGQVCKM